MADLALAAPPPADMEGIYDDLYSIERGRAALNRRNAVFKFQSPIGVTDVDDLERRQRIKKKKKQQQQRDQFGAPVVQFAKRAPRMQQAPTHMTQQRPNELKYFYTLPIQTPRAPPAAAGTGTGRRRPRERGTGRSRPQQHRRPPPQQQQSRHPRDSSLQAVPPSRRRAQPAAPQTRAGRRRASQRNAGTQADIFDTDDDADAPVVEARQHDGQSQAHPSSFRLPNHIQPRPDQPNRVDDRGGGGGGVLDGARARDLPDYHNPPATPPASGPQRQQQQSQPAGAGAQVAPSLSSQLALQMILQTLTQGAAAAARGTGSTTTTNVNSAGAHGGIDLDLVGADVPGRTRPAALHDASTPLERDFYSPGSISWSRGDDGGGGGGGSPHDHPRRGFAHARVTTRPPNMSTQPPPRRWYSGVPATDDAEAARDEAGAVPVGAPAVSRSLVGGQPPSSPEALLLELCIESFRKDAAAQPQQPAVPAEELMRRHAEAVAEAAGLAAQQRVSRAEAATEAERLRLALEQEKLQHEGRLAAERERLAVERARAAVAADALRGELRLKEAALEAKAAELERVDKERHWALERERLEAQLRGEARRVDTEVAQQQQQLGVFQKQVDDLCAHLERATRAVEDKEADKARALAEERALHELNVDQLNRRIRALQEDFARQQQQQQQQQQQLEQQQQQQQLANVVGGDGNGAGGAASGDGARSSGDEEGGGGKGRRRHGRRLPASAHKYGGGGDGTPLRRTPLLLHTRANKNVRSAVAAGDPTILRLFGPSDDGPGRGGDNSDGEGEGPRSGRRRPPGNGHDEVVDDDDDTEGLLQSSDDEFDVGLGGGGGGGADSDDDGEDEYGGGPVEDADAAGRRSIPLRAAPVSARRPYHRHPPLAAAAAVGGGFGLRGAHQSAATGRHGQPLLRHGHLHLHHPGDGNEAEGESSFTLSESSGAAGQVSFESDDTSELLAGRFPDEEADWSALSHELNDDSMDMPLSD